MIRSHVQIFQRVNESIIRNYVDFVDSVLYFDLVLWDTVNKRAVRILLECILVLSLFTLTIS